MMALDEPPPKTLRCGEFSGEVEDVGCPICVDPSRPRLVFKQSSGVSVWICPECEIMYASPRFTENALADIYENEAFVDQSFYEDWSYEKWKTKNINRSYVPQTLKIQLIRRFLSQEDRILDVGCGTGLFCLEASKQDLNVEGVDPSRMLIDLGQRLFEIPLHHSKIEDFDPGYKYRGIVLWAVLEHVYNLKDMIKRCGHLLDDGGYLFVDVPNHEGASNRFKTFLNQKGIKKDDFKHFGFPWHIYSFNKKSLSRLMRACGFEPVLFEFWSHVLKDGANGMMARIAVWLTQKYEFSDYITLVAKKKARG
jgi:2-polyprenyl-3-methyl-5-hydroxy-6-metoxy-1,4-benzoquinol methylase